MLFSIEPYAGKPGIGGIRLENQVSVTEGEPDIFTTLPFDERPRFNRGKAGPIGASIAQGGASQGDP
jgi:hypothetical protein